MAGTFVFSLDTELAWGTADKGGLRVYRRQLKETRSNVEKLLAMLHRYDVPATWAFVGHLFLDSCHRDQPGGDPHPDVLTPRYPGSERNWHEPDPATSRDSDPLWYGDDLLEMVLNASPKHEIGCHTFSHLPLQGPSVTEEIARSQVDKCRDLAQDRGLEMRSFVFPRNRVAHLDVLRESGFACYRGPERSWYTTLPRLLSRAGHFAHRFLGITPPVYSGLEADSGLVNIPASMFLMPPTGVRSLIPGRSRVRQAARGLRKSAESDALFHLWFHPWNIGDSAAMLEWLEAILREVDALRSQDRLRVMTMGGVANEVLAGAR